MGLEYAITQRAGGLISRRARIVKAGGSVLVRPSVTGGGGANLRIARAGFVDGD